MSSIGGVGMIGGLGAMSPGLSVGGVSSISTGGLNGPLGDVNVATMSAMSNTRMDQLLQLMDGFSSAEILIALMMSGSHKKHECGSDAAMGFLLGLSLASQLGQGQLQPMSPPIAAGGAPTGGQINLTA